MLDIFENPYGPPDPWSPKTPSNNKKKFQKLRKPRSSPKVNVCSPKVNVLSPKVNVKYFQEFLKNLKFLKFPVGGGHGHRGFEHI